jgi:large subunit ribosomal protein L9
MEVILLENIYNVGGVGDRVKVKSGFARNYLLPQGKATLATPENIAKFEAVRADLETKAAEELTAAQQRAAKLEGQVLKVTAQAGPEGKLFGSVGPVDIASACEALGVEVERSEVRMPDGPIRVTGEHEIELHLYADVDVPITVIVEPSDSSASAVTAEAYAEVYGEEEGTDETDASDED